MNTAISARVTLFSGQYRSGLRAQPEVMPSLWNSSTQDSIHSLPTTGMSEKTTLVSGGD
jgi:hypothetical protein